jgi:hypothetical protein
MFGFFKRTKVLEWEVRLLKNVIMKLPKEYSYLIDQINDGLFRGVLVDSSDIPGYVSFTYHSSVLTKYDREQERDFKIANIKVYDNKSSHFLKYEIYVSSGTINGYSLEGGNKHDIDFNKIDVTNFVKVPIGESDYHRISHLFSKEEKTLLNISQIYSIFIDGKEYFHIKDLENGDFVGVDETNNIFKIFHDPLEAILINRDEFTKILREGK